MYIARVLIKVQMYIARVLIKVQMYIARVLIKVQVLHFLMLVFASLIPSLVPWLHPAFQCLCAENWAEPRNKTCPSLAVYKCVL